MPFALSAARNGSPSETTQQYTIMAIKKSTENLNLFRSVMHPILASRLEQNEVYVNMEQEDQTAALFGANDILWREANRVDENNVVFIRASMATKKNEATRTLHTGSSNHAATLVSMVLDVGKFEKTYGATLDISLKGSEFRQWVTDACTKSVTKVQEAVKARMVAA